jgi:hypothetical protein
MRTYEAAYPVNSAKHGFRPGHLTKRFSIATPAGSDCQTTDNILHVATR